MSDEECSICGLELKDKYTYELNCNHKFHYECLMKSFMNTSKLNNKNNKNNCPYCRSSKNYLTVINGVKKVYPHIHNVDDNYILSYQVKKCEHILTRGKNKGNQCSKNCKLGNNYCSVHSKNK